jgi:4-aminobutyrate aminotransferase-like enzyme
MLSDDRERREHRYCSQGDTASKRKPKRYFQGSVGHFLFDEQGRRYLDFQMFNSAANFGYRSPPHVATAERMINSIPCLSSEFVHDSRVDLAERIAVSLEERCQQPGRVHFSVGGAQAIDTALMILASTTGSRRVFCFEGSYHGRTIAATEISASYRYRRMHGGLHRSIVVPFPYCHRCPYGMTFADCSYYCVEQFARLFSSASCGIIDGSGHSDVAAFIAEPVLGRGGYIPAPPDYFRLIQAILREHGILFIADEIQMAFYRTGHLWSFQHYGVAPDIVVFGKSVTNGMYPLSGVWARDPLMSDANWPSSSAQATYDGAPLGMALGLTTFDLIDDLDLATHTARCGDRIESILRDLQSKYPLIGAVNRTGMAFSLDIGSVDMPDAAAAYALVEVAQSGNISGNESDSCAGLIMTVGGIFDNMITLAPPLLIDDDEILMFSHLIQRTFANYISD